MNILAKAALASLGVLAFGIVFHADRKKLGFFALAGAISWLTHYYVTLLTGDNLYGSFAAAVASSIYAEVLARKQKTPVTVYFIAGILPLVPGKGIYETMEFFVLGDNEKFVQTGLNTLAVAAVIGFAMIVVSSIVRMYYTGLRILRSYRDKIKVKGKKYKKVDK